MDLEEYLERGRVIANGIQKLENDLYDAAEEGEAGPERDELVKQAKKKIRLYEELMSLLEGDEDWQGETERRFSHYMESLKEDVERIESKG